MCTRKKVTSNYQVPFGMCTRRKVACKKTKVACKRTKGYELPILLLHHVMLVELNILELNYTWKEQ